MEKTLNAPVVTEKARAALKGLYFTGRLVCLMVAGYLIVRGVDVAQTAARQWYWNTVAEYVADEVAAYDIEIDTKKGIVKPIGEVEDGVLAKKLFVMSIQYRNCVGAMDEIQATSQVYSGRVQ